MKELEEGVRQTAYCNLRSRTRSHNFSDVTKESTILYYDKTPKATTIEQGQQTTPRVG